MFDQAALSLGLVTVPLYTDDRPDNIAYILKGGRRERPAGAGCRALAQAGRGGRAGRPLKRVLLLEDSDAARRLAAEDERVRVVDAWLPSHAGTC